MNGTGDQGRVSIWVRRVLSILTIALLAWHGIVMNRQAELLRGQTQMLMKESYLERRAKLIDVLFSCTEVEKEPDDGRRWAVRDCIVNANSRARRDALISFLQMEREKGVRPDLAGVDLRQLFVPFVDFRQANLRNANMTGIIAPGANFGEANLYGAQMSGSRLRFSSFLRANLVDAWGEGADFRYSIFVESRFHDAFVSGRYDWAVFRDVNLSRTGMQPSYVSLSCFDGTVDLPNHLYRYLSPVAGFEGCMNGRDAMILKMLDEREVRFGGKDFKEGLEETVQQHEKLLQGVAPTGLEE